MATYTGDVHFYFNGNLNAANFDNETIADNLLDAEFTAGEIVNDGTGNLCGDGLGTYVGSIDIGGTLYPIFSDENAGTLADPALFLVTPTGFFTAANLPADLSSATTASTTECFLTGTHIATPEGESRVEELNIGDEILTAGGEAIAIRWIGVQRVYTAFRPPERLRPVRVSAGALGDGLPKRDLRLTADHALVVDGLLINAGALVNGASIDWASAEEMGEFYTVYHIETENHEVILAEGTPAETYIDYIGRSHFHNYSEYVALYGEERTIAEMDRPRISTPRLVPAAIRARLAADKAA
ncbi:MAG: Hint domain-containing protein [Marinovum algicola]|uniref:Hint domain-containing protein n=1 Tax=Marinovum algicola TaxID=42444 RepID=UPI0032ECDD4C